MELVKKTRLPRKYELRMKRDINIGIGYLFSASKDQVPGYLSVKVDSYSLDYRKIKFFGVSQQGAPISGRGVTASKVNDNKSGETILLFSISKLIKSGQFNEKVVEGVITLADQEIGRDRIETTPAIYLG